MNNIITVSMMLVVVVIVGCARLARSHFLAACSVQRES